MRPPDRTQPIVAQAPPLTHAQRARLAAILSIEPGDLPVKGPYAPPPDAA